MPAPLPCATMATRFAVAIAGMIACTTLQHAHACPAFDPFTAEEFISAPLMLVGEITDSQTIPGTNSTRITLQVSERLIGEAASEVTLLWPGHPYNPKAPVWTDSPNVIIAAVPPRTGEPELSGLSYPDVAPNLPAIRTSWCGSSGVIPASSTMAGEIRDIITQQRVWNLAALLAVIALIAFVLRHFSNASFDQRVRAELHKLQRAHTEKLQVIADGRLRGNDTFPL